MPETISREELEQLIDHRVVTVAEALPEPYFEQERLPAAVNVPHDADRERIEELLPTSRRRSSHTARVSPAGARRSSPYG